MKIGIVLGTRAEIIKLYSVIKECERLQKDYFVIHTGQHFDDNMSKVFFEQLGLPMPKYNLGNKSNDFAKTIKEVVEIFEKEKPDIILVQGDTDSALAGGIAGLTYGCMIGHIEAGLRSGDMCMPEEKNRIILDRISDLQFVPTEEQVENLTKENAVTFCFMVGNTVVDCVKDFIK